MDVEDVVDEMLHWSFFISYWVYLNMMTDLVVHCFSAGNEGYRTRSYTLLDEEKHQWVYHTQNF